VKGVTVSRGPKITKTKEKTGKFKNSFSSRRFCIGFLLLGSLVFNIFSYFTSEFDYGLEMCELGLLDQIGILSENFEVLKRLNGVYVLILHFAQQRFRFLVKKKFGNCCKRSVPREPENNENAAEITAETQL
jgi:hypothetical protein